MPHIHIFHDLMTQEFKRLLWLVPKTIEFEINRKSKYYKEVNYNISRTSRGMDSHKLFLEGQNSRKKLADDEWLRLSKKLLMSLYPSVQTIFGINFISYWVLRFQSYLIFSQVLRNTLIPTINSNCYRLKVPFSQALVI